MRSYSDQQIIKKIGKDKFAELSKEFFDLIELGIGGRALTRIQKQALYVQMLKCLAQNILSMELPVTINTMVSHFTLLHHSIDLCFPGYLDSGLLYYIVLPKAV